MGLLYKKQSGQQLRAFCDINYAGDLNDRKSTSGFVYSLSSAVVSWSSKKQLIVPLFTTEAEFVVVAHCIGQGNWLKRIIEELGLKQEECLTVQYDKANEE